MRSSLRATEAQQQQRNTGDGRAGCFERRFFERNQVSMPRCVERDLRQKRRILLLCFTPMRLALSFLTKLSVNLEACFFPEIFFFVAVSALFFILSRAGVCKDDLRFGNLLSRSQKNKGCVHAHEARKEPATSVCVLNGIFSLLFCFETTPADQRTGHPSSTEKALCVLNEVFWRRKMAVFELKGERRVWLALSCLSLASPSLCQNYFC